jgi:hypothetical protein
LTVKVNIYEHQTPFGTMEPIVAVEGDDAVEVVQAYVEAKKLLDSEEEEEPND